MRLSDANPAAEATPPRGPPSQRSGHRRRDLHLTLATKAAEHLTAGPGGPARRAALDRRAASLPRPAGPVPVRRAREPGRPSPGWPATSPRGGLWPLPGGDAALGASLDELERTGLLVFGGKAERLYGSAPPAVSRTRASSRAAARSPRRALLALRAHLPVAVDAELAADERANQADDPVSSVRQMRSMWAQAIGGGAPPRAQGIAQAEPASLAARSNRLR